MARSRDLVRHDRKVALTRGMLSCVEIVFDVGRKRFLHKQLWILFHSVFFGFSSTFATR